MPFSQDVRSTVTELLSSVAPHMLSHVNWLDSSTHKLDRTPGGKGGNPNVNIINEAGLYEAILGSERMQKPMITDQGHSVHLLATDCLNPLKG